MSRQEIDRILKADLTCIDSAISKQMKAIDMLTGQMGEKSEFLTQFQLLLQQQISKQQEDELCSDREKEEQLCNYRESVTNVELGSISSSYMDKVCSLDVEQKEQQTQKEYGKNQKKCHKCHGIVEQLKNKVRILQKILKDHHDELQYYFQQEKLKLSVHFERSIQSVIELQSQKYEELLETMKRQNESLRQQLQTLKIESPMPLTQNISNESELNKMTKTVNWVLTASENSCKKSSESSFPFSFNSSRKDLTVKPSIIQNLNSTDKKQRNDDFWFTSTQQYESQVIPDIKFVKVGVAPVKNGFGILKSGSNIVYRGMWKEGKFDGKGKLTWSNYTYEGDFKEGYFEGYGKLQLKEGTYLGKFQHHKASGEGTYTANGTQICGYWKNNSLVQRY